jgi:hypothetical protein
MPVRLMSCSGISQACAIVIACAICLAAAVSQLWGRLILVELLPRTEGGISSSPRVLRFLKVQRTCMTLGPTSERPRKPARRGGPAEGWPENINVDNCQTKPWSTGLKRSGSGSGSPGPGCSGRSKASRRKSREGSRHGMNQIRLAHGVNGSLSEIPRLICPGMPDWPSENPPRQDPDVERGRSNTTAVH